MIGELLTENVIQNIFIAKALLELFESGEMIINTWTLDRLWNFKSLPGFPVFIASVLFHLIAASVVNEPNLFASDFQNMGFFVKFHLLEDFWKRQSHGFDLMNSL